MKGVGVKMPILLFIAGIVSLSHTSTPLNPRSEKSTYYLPGGSRSILKNPLKTTFHCDGLPYGFYADIDNSCKIFHLCVPLLEGHGIREYDSTVSSATIMHSYVCSNNTIFDQSKLVCTYPENAISCSESAKYVSSNKRMKGDKKIKVIRMDDNGSLSPENNRNSRERPSSRRGSFANVKIFSSRRHKNTRKQSFRNENLSLSPPQISRVNRERLSLPQRFKIRDGYVDRPVGVKANTDFKHRIEVNGHQEIRTSFVDDNRREIFHRKFIHKNRSNGKIKYFRVDENKAQDDRDQGKDNFESNHSSEAVVVEDQEAIGRKVAYKNPGNNFLFAKSHESNSTEYHEISKIQNNSSDSNKADSYNHYDGSEIEEPLRKFGTKLLNKTETHSSTTDANQLEYREDFNSTHYEMEDLHKLQPLEPEYNEKRQPIVYEDTNRNHFDHLKDYISSSEEKEIFDSSDYEYINQEGEKVDDKIIQNHEGDEKLLDYHSLFQEDLEKITEDVKPPNYYFEDVDYYHDEIVDDPESFINNGSEDEADNSMEIDKNMHNESGDKINKTNFREDFGNTKNYIKPLNDSSDIDKNQFINEHPTEADDEAQIYIKLGHVDEDRVQFGSKWEDEISIEPSNKSLDSTESSIGNYSDNLNHYFDNENDTDNLDASRRFNGHQDHLTTDEDIYWNPQALEWNSYKESMGITESKSYEPYEIDSNIWENRENLTENSNTTENNVLSLNAYYTEDESPTTEYSRNNNEYTRIYDPWIEQAFLEDSNETTYIGGFPSAYESEHFENEREEIEPPYTVPYSEEGDYYEVVISDSGDVVGTSEIEKKHSIGNVKKLPQASALTLKSHNDEQVSKSVLGIFNILLDPFKKMYSDFQNVHTKS